MQQQDQILFGLAGEQDQAAWDKVVFDIDALEHAGGKGSAKYGAIAKDLKKDEQNAARLDLQLRFASAKAYLDSA